jgi:hypothetical protein
MDFEKRKKAADASIFLSEHPAYNSEQGSALFDGLWFMMAVCCKYGKTGDPDNVNEVTIYFEGENIEKYNDLFMAEYPEDYPYLNELHSVDIPYEEYYGEPWKEDHVEYWYETTFHVFQGNPYCKTDYLDQSKWGRYCGLIGGSLTFEDMLIDIKEKTENIFGCFDSHSFETDAEKAYFQKKWENFDITQSLINNDYMMVMVRPGLHNLRWLKWFMTTNYAKKHWAAYFGEWQANIDKINTLEPEKRKELLHHFNEQEAKDG